MQIRFRYFKFILLIVSFFVFHNISFSQLNTNTLMVQGRQKLATDQYFEAIKIFTKVIESRPKTQEAFFFRGISKFNLNDLQGARKDFQTTILLNPFYSHAYHYLGITEDRIGNYSQAFKLFDKALRLSPYDAYIYLNRGVTHLHLQQTNEAINDLDSTIILRSDIPEAYLNLSLAYEEKGDDLEALSNVNKALKLNPFMSSAYLRRALLKYKRENLEGAYKDIEQSQKIDKNNPLAFYYKANILSKQKKYEEALENYNKVLNLDPENALVYYNRAVLKSEMGQWQDAIDDYTQAININPQNILIYFARALEYYNNKQNKLAIADLNKTLEIYPSYPKAYQLRARVYEQMNQQVKANTDYLAYQNLIASDSLKKDVKNDSLLLAKIVDFESDFVNVEKVKNQRVQYKDFDLNLFPDVFFFIRQPQYNNILYDNFNEITVDGNIHQMVYYLTSPNANLDSLIRHYKQKKISYFNYFILGTCYGLKNDFNNANEQLSKSIALNPNFAYAYVNRAYFNSKLNDFLADIDDRSSKNLSMDGRLSTNKKTTRLLPIIDEKKIIHDLSIATSLDNDVMIEYNLGNAYAIHQDFIDALFWYNKSLQQANNLKWALFNRALIQIRIHDQEAACKSLSKAGELGLEEAYPLINKFCKN